MITAVERVAKEAPSDWMKLTPFAQRIKNRAPFNGSYAAVLTGAHEAKRAGKVEVEFRRVGRAGPLTGFIRKVDA